MSVLIDPLSAPEEDLCNCDFQRFRAVNFRVTWNLGLVDLILSCGYLIQLFQYGNLTYHAGTTDGDGRMAVDQR